MTVRKIRIIDDDNIRNEIDRIYEKQDQIILAKWSLEIAKHIIEIAKFDITKYPEIKVGFSLNELWQMRKAKVKDVRQIGFKIHKIAREQTNDTDKCVIRVIGQAISSGHMREHSMITSDYAIKVMGLIYDNDIVKIKEERLWQLNKLKELSK